MSVASIMIVKDEADIIETTVRHLVTQVDELFIDDNGSTDGTREILIGLCDEGLPIRFAQDTEVGYYQSRKMTALARSAGEYGHEWVVPCDADEIWYVTGEYNVATMLSVLGAEIAEATLYDHVATAADRDEPDPVKRIGWRRRDPGGLPKVACRIKPGLVIEQGNHSARYPGAVSTVKNMLVIRHFPYRSVEQMVSKVRNGAAAYRATDLHPAYGAHWRDYGDLLDAGGESAIGDVFRTWFWSADPASDETLIFDPAPV